MPTCQQCGVAFVPSLASPSRLAKRKFCSIRCAARHRAAHRPPVSRPAQVCPQCNRSFVPKDSHPAKYCSRKCRDDSQATRVELVCRQCGLHFVRKAYMKDWSQDRGPFCGFDCYAQWQKNNVRGVFHPAHQSDSKSRGAMDHRTGREAALDRDGSRCADCGSGYRLEVHHVDDPNNHVPDNLVTLCARCHRKRHPMPRGPNGRFRKIQ